MFLSAVSVLVVVQLSSEVPEGLTNNPVYNFMPVYAMKAYQGVGVLLYALSTLTLGGRERSVSQDRFT
jgi:hypothetical protein